MKFELSEDVKVLSGRWKGYTGHISHQTDPHPLSPHIPMWAVRVQTGTIRGYITIRLQEQNIESLNGKVPR